MSINWSYMSYAWAFASFFVCVLYVSPTIIDLLNLYDEHLAQNQPHNGKYCVREKKFMMETCGSSLFSPL